jgi:hypothetical protein
MKERRMVKTKCTREESHKGTKDKKEMIEKMYNDKLYKGRKKQMMKQEVLGRTNTLLSYDMTRTS